MVWIIAGFWRSGLLLLAFAMCWRWRQPQFIPLLGFGLFMCLLASFVLRHLEIRYLIQVDTLLNTVAAVVLADMLTRWWPALTTSGTTLQPLNQTPR